VLALTARPARKVFSLAIPLRSWGHFFFSFISPRSNFLLSCGKGLHFLPLPFPFPPWPLSYRHPRDLSFAGGYLCTLLAFFVPRAPFSVLAVNLIVSCIVVPWCHLSPPPNTGSQHRRNEPLGFPVFQLPSDFKQFLLCPFVRFLFPPPPPKNSFCVSFVDKVFSDFVQPTIFTGR